MRVILSLIGLYLLLSLLALATWVTHMWWSLAGLFSGRLDTLSEVVVALLGIFIPPIGCLHGIYLWFT